MPKISAYECNVCGDIFKQINVVRVQRIGTKQITYHFCDNCMDNVQFHMQPRNRET